MKKGRKTGWAIEYPNGMLGMYLFPRRPLGGIQGGKLVKVEIRKVSKKRKK